MHTGAKLRHDAELALIALREADHLALNREKAGKTARIAHSIRGNRPGDDHFVADIGVHCAAVVIERLVDIEKEARKQLLNPQFTHLLSECGRASNVEKHHDQLFEGGAMVGPQ